MTTDWTHVFADIEDRLFPQLRLGVWEKVLYYHLLRHTRIADTPRTTVSIASLATLTSMSESTVRVHLFRAVRKLRVALRDRHHVE